VTGRGAEGAEPKATPQIVSTASDVESLTPVPVEPAAANVAGRAMTPVSWAQAVAVAERALTDAEAKRSALAEREVIEILAERDDAEEWADRLARAIAAATGVDIGEHSNLNNPWGRALEAVGRFGPCHEHAVTAEAVEALLAFWRYWHHECGHYDVPGDGHGLVTGIDAKDSLALDRLGEAVEAALGEAGHG